MKLIDRGILSRGWKKFYIMHKDRHVATIREDGTCTVYFPAFMPYNLYLETSNQGSIDVRLNNLNNFYYWCASRVLSLDRQYLKEILNSIGAIQATTDKERAMIAISYHGLSLTDAFWIKGFGETITFSDISLYTHSLSGAFADVSLKGRQLAAENAELISEKDAAGDISTQGVAPKAWIRDAEGFCLLKDGAERDVDAELLASRIADCFDVQHVRYEPSEFEGKKVSRSRIITSEDMSIVPMEYVEIYCINHGIDRQKFVLKKDAYSYYMMNIIDYLVGNTDRHWGNWGFFADNKTNKLTKLYPMMDFNKAFTAYDSIDGVRCQTVEGNVSQREAAIRAVKRVGLNQIKSVDDSWFTGKSDREMFNLRLEELKKAEQSVE